MKIFAKGFNYRQDGPGNRLVYHLAGCNMRCPWCSNPEGMSDAGREICTVEQIVAECKSCRPMLFGGGGVTFTGGEATLQAEELLQVLKELQAAGIHTAIETNGTARRLPEIAAHVDYLIMDFKHFDSDRLRQVTGVGNELLRQNYEYFCHSGRQLHIRIPLINGFNADDPVGFASYFAQQDTANVCFEFLAYHEYGKDKWQTPYTVTDGFVSAAQVEAFENTFADYKLNLINT